ncbi:hypothetical protein GQ53DRAFT_771118 [Thozetella sp. PMI_491]|nr:hypothetical protein GQ53DRAFT_771118 [Thozetella sp. PMI_491]
MEHDDAPEVYHPSDKEVVPGVAPEASSPQGVTQPAGMLAASRRQRQICGCGALTFVLSSIITGLVIGVIALAAGVGVEANRANRAEAQLMAAGSTPTTNPSETFNSLDLNCTQSPSVVSGTIFQTIVWKQNFQIACNIDTPYSPLQSLFVADFADCMAACASYSAYTPKNFISADAGVNKTCGGVTFVPLWTNQTKAMVGGATGNCYLKPGPMKESDLTAPQTNIGTEIHSAFAVNITFVGGGALVPLSFSNTSFARSILRVTPKVDIYVAKIPEMKTLDESKTQDIVDENTWAVKTADTHIITMSFGEPGPPPPPYPASHVDVIRVHASDGFGNPANFNPSPDPHGDNVTNVGIAIDSSPELLYTYREVRSLLRAISKKREG